MLQVVNVWSSFGWTSSVFCDNQGVVNNTTMPESVLSKKHNQICYHRVQEAVAAGIIWIAKEDTETNLADILTKPLALPKRHFLLQGFSIELMGTVHSCLLVILQTVGTY